MMSDKATEQLTRQFPVLDGANDEINAIYVCCQLLEEFDPGTLRRILAYLNDKYGREPLGESE